MSTSDVMLAAVSEDLRQIRSEMRADRDNASESRRRVYEQLEDVKKGQGEQTQRLEAASTRLEAVEKSMEDAAPTLAEYRAYKQRVKGAGMLGRSLWIVGGAVLTCAGAIYGFWGKLTALWIYMMR